jgi:hypothetical protein
LNLIFRHHDYIPERTRYAAAAIEQAGQQPEWFRSKNISLRLQRTEI